MRLTRGESQGKRAREMVTGGRVREGASKAKASKTQNGGAEETR